jgi:ZIP family zinc transporter
MDPFLVGILLSALAGASIPAGAFFASKAGLLPDWLGSELHHTMAAFGAGALLSAIAFVLLPEAAVRLDSAGVVASFLAGGVVFYGIDMALARFGRGAGMILAMMLDYLPEAIALGALVLGDLGTALFTAALIAMQNLPEGFTAYRAILKSGHEAPRQIILLFMVLVPIGSLAALLGLTVLHDRDAVLGIMMAFAAGGILYLVVEDVAPEARDSTRRAPPLGAVAGFALGLAGHLALV